MTTTTATRTRKPTTRTRKVTPAAPTAGQIKKARSRDRVVLLTQVITSGYLITAVAISFSHIAAAFGLLGSDWQRWIAPVIIDTVAIIGKISMSTAFTPKTRSAGKRALMIAGTISFAANVGVGYAEHLYGNAILGGLVVAGALWAENHLAGMTKSTAK